MKRNHIHSSWETLNMKKRSMHCWCFHIFYGQHDLTKPADKLLYIFSSYIFFHLEAGKIQKLLYSNYSDAKVVISWEPSFYHPTHFPFYIVTINNRTTVMKNRILRFQSTNLTQTFNIKVSHLVTANFKSTYMDVFNKKLYWKILQSSQKSNCVGVE